MKGGKKTTRNLESVQPVFNFPFLQEDLESQRIKSRSASNRSYGTLEDPSDYESSSGFSTVSTIVELTDSSSSISSDSMDYQFNPEIFSDKSVESAPVWPMAVTGEEMPVQTSVSKRRNRPTKLKKQEQRSVSADHVIETQAESSDHINPSPENKSRAQTSKPAAETVIMEPDHAAAEAQLREQKKTQIKLAIAGKNGSKAIEEYYSELLIDFSELLQELKIIVADPEALAICQEQQFAVTEHKEEFEKLATKISASITYWQKAIPSRDSQKSTRLDDFIQSLDFLKLQLNHNKTNYQKQLAQFIEGAKQNLPEKIRKAKESAIKHLAKLPSNSPYANKTIALNKENFAEQLTAIREPFHLSSFIELYKDIKHYLIECRVYQTLAHQFIRQTVMAQKQEAKMTLAQQELTENWQAIKTNAGKLNDKIKSLPVLSTQAQEFHQARDSKDQRLVDINKFATHRITWASFYEEQIFLVLEPDQSDILKAQKLAEYEAFFTDERMKHYTQLVQELAKMQVSLLSNPYTAVEAKVERKAEVKTGVIFEKEKYLTYAQQISDTNLQSLILTITNYCADLFAIYNLDHNNDFLIKKFPILFTIKLLSRLLEDIINPQTTVDLGEIQNRFATIQARYEAEKLKFIKQQFKECRSQNKQILAQIHAKIDLADPSQHSLKEKLIATSAQIREVGGTETLENLLKFFGFIAELQMIWYSLQPKTEETVDSDDRKAAAKVPYSELMPDDLAENLVWVSDKASAMMTYTKETASSWAQWGLSYLPTNYSASISRFVPIKPPSYPSPALAGSRGEGQNGGVRPPVNSSAALAGSQSIRTSERMVDAKHLDILSRAGHSRVDERVETTGRVEGKYEVPSQVEPRTVFERAEMFLRRARELNLLIQQAPKLQRSEWDMADDRFKLILAFAEPISLYNKFLKKFESFVAARQITEDRLKPFVADFNKFQPFFATDRLRLYTEVIDCVNARKMYDYLQRYPQLVERIIKEAENLTKGSGLPSSANPFASSPSRPQTQEEIKRRLRLDAEIKRATDKQTRIKKVLYLIFNNQYWTKQTNYQWLNGGVQSEYGSQERIPTRLAQLQKSIVLKLRENHTFALPGNQQQINFNEIPLRAADIDAIQALLNTAGNRAMSYYVAKFASYSCGLFGSRLARGLFNQRSDNTQRFYESLAVLDTSSDSIDRFIESCKDSKEISSESPAVQLEAKQAVGPSRAQQNILDLSVFS